MGRLISIAAVVSLLIGCSSDNPLIDHEFQWIQSEDGIGMKAPITYSVRLELHGDMATIREKFVDTNGLTYIQSTTRPCQVFDSNDFNCALIPQDTFTMKNGTLSQHYWGQDREYRKRLLILGHGF